MKKFEITEQEIKENKDLTLKEYFKEVFEIKLEVGKWYKDEGDVKNSGLICIEKYNGYYEGLTAYGFYWNTFEWSDTHDRWCCNSKDNLILATEEEVEQALIKEAEKRGYKVGCKVKCLSANEIVNIDCIDFYFWIDRSKLWLNDNCLIFYNGKWAEIISQPEEIIELNGVKYKRID